MKMFIEIIKVIAIAFAVGFLLHIGTNTAKIIWPTPPVEFKVSLDEN